MRVFGLAILFFVVVLATQMKRASADDLAPKKTNLYQMVTGDDADEDKQNWDRVFQSKTYVFGREPSEFLKKNLDLLPRGRALDIAMSEGRNAVFLAKNGFEVDGVDISEAALRKARRLARESHVKINTITADLETYAIKTDYYDLIVNIQFLQRSLVPVMKRGLKRGGVVIFENYTVDHLKTDAGKQVRRDWVLGRGELREFFKDFQILFYQEENTGREAVARIIARKP